MSPKRAAKLSVRQATEKDVRLIWEWRNDPSVREQSLSKDLIPWKDHSLWYTGKLNSPGTRIWILSYKGRAAATARYDRRSRGSAELSFFVGPKFRGNGLGSAVVEKTIPLCARELKTQTILAQVKEDNLISRTLLDHLGFEEKKHFISKGYRCIQMRKKLS